MLTIEEIKKDIATYQKRLENPVGLSEQQIAVYRQAIVEATALLQQMQAAQHGPITPPPPPTPAETLKHTEPPTPTGAPSPKPSPIEKPVSIYQQGNGAENQPPITNQPITTRTPGAQKTDKPIHATIIQASIETNPYNPVITILWDDGYQFKGDESAIKSQFISRMQDCAALKDAKDPRRRLRQMWAWNTPWRCLGLFQALIHLNDGQAPTLQQIGVDMRRASNLFIEIFQLITEKALQPQP